jgi:antitoxin ParD1/3/4
MVTRNVVVTDHQARFLDDLVASGRFQNVSEAMRAGLRLLERDEAAFEEVRRGVLEGLEQMRRGEVSEDDGLDAMRQIADRVLGRT